MYTRCLVCRTPFPEPGILKHVPRGDRVAFDLKKGRLWIVCRFCRRWSLVPLESRWEAMEELDAMTAGPARVQSRTRNIGLFQKGPLEIVRIGGAGSAEEAWWRYGRQIPDRNPWRRWTPPILRQLRFGSLAWVGKRSCPACGFLFEGLPFADRKILLARPHDEGFSLHRRCPRCRSAGEGGLDLVGVEAELTLARLMAYQNDLGESRITVEAAARLLDDPEGPMDLVRLLSRHGKPLGEMLPIGLTALEITVNTARERTLLKLEAEALQARWRREEELAALVDGELSPVDRLQSLIRRVRGG